MDGECSAWADGPRRVAGKARKETPLPPVPTRAGRRARRRRVQRPRRPRRTRGVVRVPTRAASVRRRRRRARRRSAVRNSSGRAPAAPATAVRGSSYDADAVGTEGVDSQDRPVGKCSSQPCARGPRRARTGPAPDSARPGRPPRHRLGDASSSGTHRMSRLAASPSARPTSRRISLVDTFQAQPHGVGSSNHLTGPSIANRTTHRPGLPETTQQSEPDR